jgi:hypothetical protein
MKDEEGFRPLLVMQKQEGCDEEGESLHVASKTKRT